MVMFMAHEFLQLLEVGKSVELAIDGQSIADRFDLLYLWYQFPKTGRGLASAFL